MSQKLRNDNQVKSFTTSSTTTTSIHLVIVDNKMNRKAKIAYAHIIIGFVLFLIGLVTILNYSLNSDEFKSHAQTASDGSNKRLNLSELLAIVASSKSKQTAASQKFGHDTANAHSSSSSSSLASSSFSSTKHQHAQQQLDDDINIYIYWFCQMKNELSSEPALDKKESPIVPTTIKTTKTIASVFAHNKQDYDANRDEANSDADEQIRLIKSPILNSIFSFLICSTDKIYLIMIICLTVLGCFVLLYGCIRFYEHDIKLMQQSVAPQANGYGYI